MEQTRALILEAANNDDDNDHKDGLVKQRLFMTGSKVIS
jgi:hypothetical protein